ncbi:MULTISPECIES: glycosyltransferase family 2 protein [Methanothermobacter]|uniref:Rhamnosyl transferase n=1 Tax=Methanothermobacter thermautotrophicus (strain ATCC 29096 / DSM 1053 / JCM 10044 / NBRC 100330 / Delta H) TaxID=187420 RepID=O26443_METTH|nr:MULTISPECIES: glycosyltransferase family 2 protein [Methanothermobacter]AAB84849.1 rhamnosyl transferase [Methanothermobacter thermautotrophicus str. Delta H]MDI6818572.1 glycosyltransferase family 2 protein [Methanothermobacter thermautotrophicus]WBF06639.1 glycosyltransferase family 2 protein [Methanothermobacter thermautotrophicus]BAZ98387.1 Galactofuranosyl transferase GlfT1 [Methanothermobacter sp. EMTCatA1]
MRVCAVVVTYNRKDLLVECLEALRRQTGPLDAIYIIDNASTDGTPELLRSRGYRDGAVIENPLDGSEIVIRYVRLPVNTGGAGGFHEGVKRAFHDGYDWIWLMDDDAEPLPDSLQGLLRYADDDTAALANLKVSPDGRPQYIHRGFFDFDSFGTFVRPVTEDDLREETLEIDHASFVGILINSDSVREIGFPRKEFFLHYDDVEYCLRLRSTGKIILVPGSLILHKEAAERGNLTKGLFGREIPVVPYDKLWLRYYGVRNSIWLRRKEMGRARLFIFMVRAILLSVAAQIITGIREKPFRRVRFILSAYSDGLRGRFDNEKPRRILYG